MKLISKESENTLKSKILLILMLTSSIIYSQTGLNFQGVARNSNNVILASQQISLRLSIIQGSVTGNTEYSETRLVNTNAQGLFSVVIGDLATTSTVGNFSSINWKSTPKYLKIEMDAQAGSNFVYIGTTQLQYVAYAQYANGVDADNINGIVPITKGGTGTNSLANLKTALQVPDTTSLSSRINLKLAITDTADMLSNRLKRDTASLSSRINLKLAIADTADMLSNLISRIIVSDLTSKTLDTAIYHDPFDFKNISFKDSTLFNVTTAENLSNGKNALAVNSNGIANVSFGINTLASNTTGSANAAFGFNALKSNNIGNVNSAFGSYALYNNTTGNLNTAMGSSAMISNTTGVNNTAIGVHALFYNTIGISNTASGSNALSYNTEGNYNTANGRGALRRNTTGSYNTSNGYGALYSNLLGQYNTANGVNSLYFNSGSYNTAYGANSLYLYSSGTYNTAIGYYADLASDGLSNATAIGANAKVAASNSIQLGDAFVTNVNTSGTITAGAITYPNTHGTSGQVLSTTGSGTLIWSSLTSSGVPYSGATGAVNLGAYDLIVNELTIGKGSGAIASNTAIGKSALYSNTTGSRNTANGFSSLYLNTTGSSNTANGNEALYNNTTGSFNVANGNYALYSNTTGSYNTANGNEALYTNTTGNSNTANGYQSLQYNTTGYSNTANGFYSLNKNTTGNSNTAYGNSALFNNNGSSNSSIGFQSMLNNTTGSFNTAIGYESLKVNTTGSFNTAIGYLADVGSGTISNSTAIGYNAKVNSSNTIQLGDSNVTNVISFGKFNAPGFITTSDLRLKRNIQPLINSLQIVNQLNPVSYQKKRSLSARNYEINENGFIAQEIRKVLPELVEESKDKDKLLSVNYTALIPILTKSIQELNGKIENLQKENKELNNRIIKLEKLMNTLLESKK